MFYDTEHETFITMAELEKEFMELKETGETEAETFGQYINNCLTTAGGTLERIR